MERRAIVVRGIVQGVGFRPFVHSLASRLHLGGFVRNETGNVTIEIEGEPARIEQFLDELSRRPPPLAQIDQVSCHPLNVQGQCRFSIQTSRPDRGGQVFICPDIATCPECLGELMDPRDRRYRYAFLNCTNCGPRLTIITGAPYDRPQTTMARFPMCPACRAEYEDPDNRRFHAQPIACPRCGPQLDLRDPTGGQSRGNDALTAFIAALSAGRIGAVKGLGGFHLVCDAADQTAVAELRRRKHRAEKPFAIMVRDLHTAQSLCRLDDNERKLLVSPQRPIVLLDRHACARIAPAVAPGRAQLGVMLPYTPLHHLLLHDFSHLDHEPAALVMTSGNRSDEPITYDNDQALEQLGDIADLFLMHDRPIHVPCDDSVTRILAGREAPIRRSRGYAPGPIRLPVACSAPILAVGGQLKATFALARQHQAFLSHHLGDLDHYQACKAFERDIDLYQRLLAIHPRVIVHDLHPDYASTRYAKRHAAAQGVRLIAVQHHHAHMASCMAEHALVGPVIGVCFDGTGFGPDGTVWGGEFLVGGYAHYHRAAALRQVGMPGADQAVRQPWRMALAHLLDAGCPLDSLAQRVPADALRTVTRMLQRNFRCPPTSSAGRLFDAVAAIIGLCDHVEYEGQAAIELEQAAGDHPLQAAYPFEIQSPPAPSDFDPRLIIDTRPLIRAVTRDLTAHRPPAAIARRFHHTLIRIIATICHRVRRDTGIDTVVLSGGVFMNALLTEHTVNRLTADGLAVYHHHLVPANDGGLSLGQIAIAAAINAPGPGENNLATKTPPPWSNPCASASPAK